MNGHDGRAEAAREGDDNAYEAEAAHFAATSVLTEALEAIAADPRLAMEVIGEIASLTRDHDDEDPEITGSYDETIEFLAATIADAMAEREKKERATKAADILALHQLGRFMLGQLDKSGKDEALYVVASGVAELVADYLTHHGELVWTLAADDKVLIAMSAEGGRAPTLASGALDRARATMRDAGWLSWEAIDDYFNYTLTPPANWRELVEANEAAIAEPGQ